LATDEPRIVQQHRLIADRWYSAFSSLGTVRGIVGRHDERWDGSGYPDRLRGDAIPLLAQITAVVDIFNALTSARPYRQACPVEVALDQLGPLLFRGAKASLRAYAMRACLGCW
jgi:HD-GYP domain-containing protein (c-di-GMP phosphodiesterase class II)